jgi:hypothetical protein
MASRAGQDHPKVHGVVNDHGSSIMDDGSGMGQSAFMLGACELPFPLTAVEQ